MKIHELKTLPQYFAEQVKGIKQFEVRKNDRNYEIGDVLILKEYDNGYTGSEISVIVTYILKDFIGLKNGYVVLGTEPLTVDNCYCDIDSDSFKTLYESVYKW